MLNRIIEFSLTQRLLMLVLTALLIGAGIYSFNNVAIDAFPDVSTTQVKVIMKAPGMTPEEVEARITMPIEGEMLGIPHQSMLRSVSKYALADITIDFADGTDIYWARQQVAERLNAVTDQLPQGISGGLAPITTPLSEMMMFTIEGGDLTLAERRSLLDWVIRPALRTLPGVAEVNALGGQMRTFEVVPDQASLNARGLTLAQLQQALESNNRNDGAGRLLEGEETLLVRTEGRVKNEDDLGAIVVTSRDGNPVRVADVAKVRIGSMTRYGAVTKDGKGEVVQGLILGLRGANAQQIVNGVKAKLAELTPSFPKGVTAQLFYDRSNLVERAVATVSKALSEAIVLVVVLLVLFLGNLRAAFVASMILPLAAFTTFILMHWVGMSANLMSLGGLAIAIGMLVDSTVVVIENVQSRMASGNDKVPRLHALYRAVSEVATPVASGIIIIIIVFLPLLTLQGLEGKLFVPVALTIVFALSGSLILSLTVIPVMASYLMGRTAHQEPWIARKAAAIYIPALKWSLDHGKIVSLVAIMALAVSGVIYTLIGKTFMPTMDEGDLIMQVEMLPSISLHEAVEMNLRLQRQIMKEVPEIKSIVARAGSDELGLDPMGLNQTDTFLVLKPQTQWRVPDKEWLKEQLRKIAERFPGITYSFTQPIDMRVSEMLTGVRGDLAVKVFGPELGELNQIATKIETTLRAVAGSEEVFTLKNEGVQYLQVEVDRLAAGRFGLNVDDIAANLRAQLEGRPLGVVLEGGRRTPLLLRGDDALRSSPAMFASLRIMLPSGTTIPLADVAKLKRIDGPVKVDRESGKRMVVVQANVRGRDLVGYVEEAKRAVAQNVTLPAGYRTEWGGQFENQQRAAKRLALVVPISLGLIFLLLFATFGSVRQAILVLSIIPFALIGGVFALWLSREYLSVPASVGFIALLGIAVLNGVMMLTYFNQLYAEGMPIGRIVIEGAKRRLRPVLMTASIAGFGLVPLLFASGPGSEIQKPLAIVVIGGLVSSTLFTLILLPVLYRRFGVSRPSGDARFREN